MSNRTLKFAYRSQLAGLQPEALTGIDECVNVFHEMSLPLTITSARDGRHSRHSHHYKGLAWDIRIWDIEGKVRSVCAKLRERLGPEYQVIQESDHIHIEYDPADMEGS